MVVANLHLSYKKIKLYNMLYNPKINDHMIAFNSVQYIYFDQHAIEKVPFVELSSIRWNRSGRNGL